MLDLRPKLVVEVCMLFSSTVKPTLNTLAPQNRFEMRFTANHVSRCVIAEHAVTKKRIMLGIIAFDRSTDDWQGQQPVAAICKAHFESHPGSQRICSRFTGQPRSCCGLEHRASSNSAHRIQDQEAGCGSAGARMLGVMLPAP